MHVSFFFFRNKLEEFHTWINRIHYLQFDQDIVAICYYYFLEVEIQLLGINIKLKFIHVIVFDGHIDNNKFLDIYNCEWMHSSLTLQIYLSSIKLFYLSRRIGNLSSLMTYFSKFFIVSPFNGPYKNHRIKLFKLSKTSIEWNNAVHGLVFSKVNKETICSRVIYLCLHVKTYVFVMNHADGRHEVLINGMPGHGYIATPHPIVHAVQKNITFRY